MTHFTNYHLVGYSFFSETFCHRCCLGHTALTFFTVAMNKNKHLASFLCLVHFFSCPISLLKRVGQEVASVFCVAAPTVASVSAPHNRRNPLGFEVSARSRVSVASRRPPPHPPIPPNSPPADPAPAAAAHIPAASTQRTLLGLGCSPPAGGRGPAGRPSWLELSIEPAQRPLPPSTHRRRSSVRDTTAQHTGCSDNRRWQRGGSSDLRDVQRGGDTLKRGRVGARK